jgi:hypothetical protein
VPGDHGRALRASASVLTVSSMCLTPFDRTAPRRRLDLTPGRLEVLDANVDADALANAYATPSPTPTPAARRLPVRPFCTALDHRSPGHHYSARIRCSQRWRPTASGAVSPAVNCVLTGGRRSSGLGLLAALTAFWPHNGAQRRRLLHIVSSISAAQRRNEQIADAIADLYESDARMKQVPAYPISGAKVTAVENRPL